MIYMRLKENKLIKIYLAIIIAFLIVLFLLDLNLHNTLVLSSDFNNENHYFTLLKPQARLDGNKIISEPVYFDVKVPSVYDNVIIDLEYVDEFNNKIGVGLVDPKGNPTLQTISQTNKFDLWLALKYRFVISIPEIQENAPVQINGIKLIFKREKSNLLKYLYLWVQRFTK